MHLSFVVPLARYGEHALDQRTVCRFLEGRRIVAMARPISWFFLTCIVPAARSKSPSGGRRRLCPMHAPPRRHPLSRRRVRPVVQDDLSTHSAGALYQAFRPAEARRILQRFKFHYTPKHTGRPNVVEIEIGVLRGQCLDRRIDDPSGCAAKSPPRNGSEMPRAPASNGCSLQGARQSRPSLSRHFPKVIVTAHRY